jgi:hypothetical protein
MGPVRAGRARQGRPAGRPEEVAAAGAFWWNKPRARPLTYAHVRPHFWNIPPRQPAYGPWPPRRHNAFQKPAVTSNPTQSSAQSKDQSRERARSEQEVYRQECGSCQRGRCGRQSRAEQSARAVEQSYSATVENMRGYNLKMIDMAQASTEEVFEFARQLATAKSPTLWSCGRRTPESNTRC